ncbi:MAG: protease complex subunit PrcB family protein, partial [Lachnospiraceae bacterium]|nr:protease complex subunit PrcB family protein [Lachnospiraceae bacterium]
MKKRAWLTGCFVMLLCMAGCGSPSIEVSDGKETLTVSEITTKEDEEPVGVAGSKEPKDKDGMVSALGDNGELLKEGALCGFQYQLGENEDYDSNYKDRGYYRYENDARAPLVLEFCSGEHSTGGYTIRIVNLEADEEGNLCVTVEETAPKPGETVTEAFTYPRATLLIYEETRMPGSVTVKTTGGAELPFLGSMPPKSKTDDEDTAWLGEKSWEKVVIAPPEGAYCNISLRLPKEWGWSSSWTEDVPVSCIGVAIYP